MIILCLLILIFVIIIALLNIFLIINKNSIIDIKNNLENKIINYTEYIENKNYTWVNNYMCNAIKKTQKLCLGPKYITWKYVPNNNISIDNKFMEKLCQMAIEAWQEITSDYIYFIKYNGSNVNMTISIQNNHIIEYTKIKVDDINYDNILAHSHGIYYMDIHINYNVLKNITISQTIVLLLHEIGHSIGAYDKNNKKYNNSIMYYKSTDHIINIFDN
ncbi:hypothetical protein CHREV_032 [Choristoneura rosaceana entomopoxvirus 'L']|uniref:Peptidase M10 metallopeptidase domain-containing protein n=1 Tax=Choristoneura rosaceana entomopoxvirus 'L' TaxID=1293539 RepID=A0ABM9QK75_9POXV|nr:hypothetical protein CHREV_032 [Choristoneura rosaceana entomopoxvirus 'L']CCU55934.1 hypothetical protein CHREV_032 [Choristoneura rosaceana entomopoxvirus 'L']